MLAMLALLGWGTAPAGAQEPPVTSRQGGAGTTSSVVPTLGTAAEPAPADRKSVSATLEPSATNRPLTSSERRLESLDRWAVGGFVLLSLIVVVVRQRRRRDDVARDDQPDEERDEWDAALEELTATYHDGAADDAGER